MKTSHTAAGPGLFDSLLGEFGGDGPGGDVYVSGTATASAAPCCAARSSGGGKRDAAKRKAEKRSRALAARVREILVDRLDDAMEHGRPFGDLLRAIEPALERSGYSTAALYEKMVEVLFWEAFVDGPDADHFPGPGLIPRGGVRSVSGEQWEALARALKRPRKHFRPDGQREGRPRTGRVVGGVDVEE